MLSDVTGMMVGSATKLSTYRMYSTATAFTAMPQRPMLNGPMHGARPRTLRSNRNKIGMKYEMYSAINGSDIKALNAVMEPILMIDLSKHWHQHNSVLVEHEPRTYSKQHTTATRHNALTGILYRTDT